MPTLLDCGMFVPPDCAPQRQGSVCSSLHPHTQPRDGKYLSTGRRNSTPTQPLPFLILHFQVKVAGILLPAKRTLEHPFWWPLEHGVPKVLKYTHLLTSNFTSRNTLKQSTTQLPACLSYSQRISFSPFSHATAPHTSWAPWHPCLWEEGISSPMTYTLRSFSRHS